ncbi:MAG: autotransporter-associated beta strand repeat-containing protein, partial [Alphaproteobacteria bacterium]|nr:autotransporter-associated beta strand repeat-containing protein [Alphaproteobacteria bacterium]
MKNAVVFSLLLPLWCSTSVSADDQVLNIPAKTKVTETTTTLSHTYPDGVSFAADTSVLAITQDSSGPSYDGPISGPGTLEINTLPAAIISLLGAGTTYTGDTQVNSGTLSTFAETVSKSFNFIGKHANLTLSLGNEVTFPGGISGEGSLTVTGGGKLTLVIDPNSPRNYNYSGGTTIEGSTLIGSVNVSSDKDSIGTIPATGSINLSERGIITFEQPSTATKGIFSGNITGEGKVIVGGQQPLTLTSTNNTYSEGTVIGDVRPPRGQLIGTADLIQDGNVITPGSLQGNIDIYSGTLTFNQQGSTEILAYRFSGNISNTSDFPNSVIIQGNTGPFILNLAGTNSYNGATTVNTNATLQGALPNSTINLAVTGATYDLNGANQTIGGVEGITNTFVNLGSATLTVGGNNAATTFSGTIQDTGLGGSLIKTGSGNLTLTNPTSYTGTTTIAEGTLTLNPVSSGLTSNIITNGILNFMPTVQGLVVYNGDISGTGSVGVESTVGPFTLNLAGRNSYTGSTTIGTNTTLQAKLPKSTSLILNAGGATFDLNNSNQTVAVLNGNTGTFVNLGANTFTVDGNTSPSTFSGVIQDNGMGGHLVKRGSQNLTLGTPPTYSGSTTIDGGSLTGQLPMNTPLIVNNGTFEMVVSQIFTTLEGKGGNIILGNSSTPYNLTVLGDSSLTKHTFAGSITGGGQLTLGSGTTTGVLELTGISNTYTGNTSVFAGSTLIGSADSFPPTSSITNSGKLIFNQSTEGTYAGIIAGAGSVEVTGGGKLTLTAIGNSYKRMTINQGTTLIGNINTLSPAPISVDDSKSTLVFSQDFSGTFSNDITGKGSLHLQGGGSLTLAGKNTYKGDTTIANDGSNLIVTINETSSSLPLTSNVIDNGTLTFNQPQSGTFTFGGNIKGLGEVVIIGPGTVNLTGTNNFQGGTITQNGGNLTGNTESISGNITNNGSVTFNQTTAGTYAGKISGAGSLIKDGGGRLALTGVSPLTGPTTIKKGILAVNGSLESSLVTVAQEGILKGSGTVGGVHLKGTVAPGNSIGTLKIRNDFIMEPTGTYEVEITPHAIKPRNSDHLMIGGKANLAGTLHVKVLGGTREDVKNKSFMCLGAKKGRFGEFSNLISDDRLKYKVIYLTKGIEVFV